MIAALPLASRAASPSTLRPLASRVPTKVDPASLHVVAPLFTIVSQRDRVVLPAPSIGPVIKGGGSGLPGVAAPPANAAIQPAPTPTATTSPVVSSSMPTGNPGAGGASSLTDVPASDPTPGAGYGGGPSFSASSFTSPTFLVGAGVVALGALYFLTRKRR